MRIPRSHPRYASLRTRELLVAANRRGVVVLEGLIAHGRGEAWDYLIGEETSAPALVAEKAAAAFLLAAKRPVISVNGNVAALAARQVARLAAAIPAKVEVNLFHRTEVRVRQIATLLTKAGAKQVLGPRPDARIPGLASQRARTHKDGIYTADVVLVPLEDGDRAEALSRMGKVVISVDLNPLSRTSRVAEVTIVDELTRALPNISASVRELKATPKSAAHVVSRFNNRENLAAVLRLLDARLQRLARNL